MVHELTRIDIIDHLLKFAFCRIQTHWSNGCSKLSACDFIIFIIVKQKERLLQFWKRNISMKSNCFLTMSMSTWRIDNQSKLDMCFIDDKNHVTC